MADRLGTQVGNYRLIQLLGRGGFAEVYLGEQVHLGTQAAVKLLHAPLASAEEVEKFRQEARTIAALLHPHIVRVLDFGVDAGLPYLVLDYAPGGSLRQRHPAGTPVPLPTVVSYVKQIAQALQYAHDQKIIHRDIKPQNLLVGRNGDILLADFGISMVAESTSRQQAQGFAGTVAYSAPEQLQEHPRPASDQYALGVVVYEWLTGKPPFTGALQDVIAKHLFVVPPSLRAHLPTLPPAVDQVVLTALAKDPRERFASVQAFARALEQASQEGSSISSIATQIATPPPQARHAGEAAGQSWRPPATPSLPPAFTGTPPAPPPNVPGARSAAVPPDAPPKRKKLTWGILLAICLIVVVLVSSIAVLVGNGKGAPGGSGTRATVTAAPELTAATATATATPEPPAGIITQFALPTASSRPAGITAGPDGNLWFTESDGNHVGRITPQGAFKEFPLPTAGSSLWGISAGPDGNLWFTEENSNQIGYITPGGSLREFRLPTAGNHPYGITAGPDGNLWFTEEDSNQIGRLTPQGAFTQFALPTAGSQPVEITAGPDGNLWFTEFAGNQIGRITTGRY
jgi:serine/threonine protein kinase